MLFSIFLMFLVIITKITAQDTDDGFFSTCSKISALNKPVMNLKISEVRYIFYFI
jgi:hypothetical protein